MWCTCRFDVRCWQVSHVSLEYLPRSRSRGKQLPWPDILTWGQVQNHVRCPFILNDQNVEQKNTLWIVQQKFPLQLANPRTERVEADGTQALTKVCIRWASRRQAALQITDAWNRISKTPQNLCTINCINSNVIWHQLHKYKDFCSVFIQGALALTVPRDLIVNPEILKEREGYDICHALRTHFTGWKKHHPILAIKLILSLPSNWSTNLDAISALAPLIQMDRISTDWSHVAYFARKFRTGGLLMSRSFGRIQDAFEVALKEDPQTWISKT